MSNISLQKWIALLSESGVELSFRGGSIQSVEAAARRLEIELEAEDLSTLQKIRDYLERPLEPQVRFAMTIFHHPKLNIPSRKPHPGGDKRKEKRRADAGVLPSWGFMDEVLMDSITPPTIPIDWNPEDNTEPTPENWQAWCGDRVARIATKLWPVYRRDPSAWTGEDVAKLFDADFELLADLHDYFGLPIDAMRPTTEMQGDCFAEEDDANTDFGTGYERYDPTLSPSLLTSLKTVMAAGMADKVGTLDLQLKQVFQRPRPFQVAFIQGRPNYPYRWAQTGNTPSLVSGHCLLGSIGGCTAFAALREEMSERSIEVLQQFTVDIGDRRVFAGIHYPSDNLASWYVALSLVPRVFAKDTARLVRGFLWDAIERKSHVFAAVSAHVRNHSDSPYKAMVTEIAHLGSG